MSHITNLSLLALKFIASPFTHTPLVVVRLKVYRFTLSCASGVRVPTRCTNNPNATTHKAQSSNLAHETETWLWRVVAAHTPMKVKLHANLNLVHVHAAQQQRVVGTV